MPKWDTYTVICQLQVPIRARDKAEAIQAVRDKIKVTTIFLNQYADGMAYFVPDDPDYNPNMPIDQYEHITAKVEAEDSTLHLSENGGVRE